MTTERRYVNNKELVADLVAYKKLCVECSKSGKSQPQIPNSIGRQIDLICRRLASRYNFANYTYRDEMVGDAVANCVAAILKFNVKKGQNAHAYFSMVAFNAMARRISVEQKQHATKHKNLENMQILMDELMPSGGNSNDSAQSDGIRRHYEVIEKYEEKLTRKKQRHKKEAGNGGDNAKRRPAATGRKRPVRKATRSKRD